MWPKPQTLHEQALRNLNAVWGIPVNSQVLIRFPAAKHKAHPPVRMHALVSKEAYTVLAD